MLKTDAVIDFCLSLFRKRASMKHNQLRVFCCVGVITIAVLLSVWTTILVRVEIGAGRKGVDTRRCDDKTSQQLEANAQLKMLERDAWINKASMSHEQAAFQSFPMTTMQSALLLAPYYPCRWTLTKSISVADQFDGGKWICGLEELSAARPRQCIAYSLGSAYDRQFEDWVSKATDGGCEIHIYDPTLSRGKDRSPERLQQWATDLPSNMHYHEEGIVGMDAMTMRFQDQFTVVTEQEFPATTLSRAMQCNDHAAGIDILKFDIESFEYELLEDMGWAAARIGLVMFELHSQLITERTGKPYTIQQVNRHFQRMEQAGYRLYSVEPVCSGCAAIEVAFVHIDWDPVYGFTQPCAATQQLGSSLADEDSSK